jgi:glycine cleavage system H protein
MNPTDIKYHKEHTWARIEGEKATVGITDYAQESLGDIVYIDLPEPGKKVVAGEEITEIESTKATSSVISPVNGTIKEINSALEDEPEVINSDPYGKGWIAVVDLDDYSGADGLMDAEPYGAFLEEEAS